MVSQRGGSGKRQATERSGRNTVSRNRTGVFPEWQTKMYGNMKLAIRTTETDPELVTKTTTNGGCYYSYCAMSTTVRLQIRVFGKWITVLKWNRVC